MRPITNGCIGESKTCRSSPRAYDLFGRLARAQGGEETEGIIERICLIVAAELRRQGLTEEKDSFLDTHCEPMLDRIKEQRIRNMPVAVW